MQKKFSLGLFLLLGILLTACRQNHDRPSELERGELLCEISPPKALDYLEQVKGRTKKWDEYQQAQFRLLCIKARDKAYIPHTDDREIRRLVAFFDQNGHDNDRMEAYYYLGSTLRDLHDGPQAVQAYLHATDIAEQSQEPVDTAALAGIFSQISELNYNIGQADLTIAYAQRALNLLEQSGKAQARAYMDVASAYRLKEQNDSVRYYSRKALEYITRTHAETEYADIIAEQMGFYLYTHDSLSVQRCLQMLYSIPAADRPDNWAAVMAHYYDRQGLSDSVIHYAELEYLQPDYFSKKEAAEYLNRHYAAKGDASRAQAYALRYMEANDSLTAQNQREQLMNSQSNYLYRKDADKELKLARKNARQNLWLFVGSSALLATLLLLAALIFRNKKNRRKYLEELLQQSEMLSQAQETSLKQAEQVDRIKAELEKQNREKEQFAHEKEKLKKELERAKLASTQQAEQISRTRKELEEQTRQIEEASREQETIKKKLHEATCLHEQMRFEAQDIIARFKEAAQTRQPVRDDELWMELLAVIEKERPDTFLQWNNRHNLTSDMLHALCLDAIGMNHLEIEYILGKCHSATWRLLSACGLVKRKASTEKG